MYHKLHPLHLLKVTKKTSPLSVKYACNTASKFSEVVFEQNM